LLLGALEKQPEDEHKVVALLKWITGEGHKAPDAKELLEPALPKEEHQKCRNLLVAIDLAVRAIESILDNSKAADTLLKIVGASMMARLADVLRGVVVVCERGLGAEAGALGRIAIEIAINASYIGMDEQKAKHFSVQATVLNQGHSDLLAKEHNFEASDKVKQAMADQVRVAKENFGEEMLKTAFPSLRSMAAATGLLELHDFGYEDLRSASHCDPRSIFVAANSLSLSRMLNSLGHTAGAANLALIALSKMVSIDDPVALHHLRQMEEVLAGVRANKLVVH